MPHLRFNSRWGGAIKPHGIKVDGAALVNTAVDNIGPILYYQHLYRIPYFHSIRIHRQRIVIMISVNGEDREITLRLDHNTAQCNVHEATGLCEDIIWVLDVLANFVVYHKSRRESWARTVRINFFNGQYMLLANDQTLSVEEELNEEYGETFEEFMVKQCYAARVMVTVGRPDLNPNSSGEVQDVWPMFAYNIMTIDLQLIRGQPEELFVLVETEKLNRVAKSGILIERLLRASRDEAGLIEYEEHIRAINDTAQYAGTMQAFQYTRGNLGLKILQQLLRALNSNLHNAIHILRSRSTMRQVLTSNPVGYALNQVPWNALELGEIRDELQILRNTVRVARAKAEEIGMTAEQCEDLTLARTFLRTLG